MSQLVHDGAIWRLPNESRVAAERRVARLAAIRSIYVIEGPSGVYVGASTEPQVRWTTHCQIAGRKPAHSDLLIHVAMRRDGVGRYTFAVVATARGIERSNETEYAVVRQMRASGARVLNVLPRTPLHTPPRFGKQTTVVVGREVQPL